MTMKVQIGERKAQFDIELYSLIFEGVNNTKDNAGDITVEDLQASHSGNGSFLKVFVASCYLEACLSLDDWENADWHNQVWSQNKQDDQAA
jgi:hypothetical protein